MMRAVKDDNELMRLAAAGSAADSAYGEIVQGVSPAGSRPKSRLSLLICCESSDTSRSTSPWSDPVPMGPTHITRRGSGDRDW